MSQPSGSALFNYDLLSRQNILAYQGLLVATAVAVSAIFYLLQNNADFMSSLIYTLVAGNIVAVCISFAAPLYDRPFPRNWIVYLAVLFPIALLASTAGSVAVWASIRGVPAAAIPGFIRQNVPFGALISLISGIAIFGYINAHARMEAANARLAQQVHRGEQEIASHAAELRAAFEIQSSLLPRSIPQIAGVEISCAWQPARTVSGDFFDVLVLDDHRLAFCLADVSGKGISAALLTANLQATFRAFVVEETSPASLCRRLNAALCGSLPPARFVTFAYGVLDRRKLTFTWELAGHNPPLLLRGTATETLPGTGPVLGLLPEAVFSDHSIPLRPGDRLVLSTDGVTEAFNAAGEEFGDSRLLAAASTPGLATANHIRAAVMHEVTRFADGHFHDDASLIVVTVTG